MTHDKLASIKTTLDLVQLDGPDACIAWLRGAFYTHESQLATLLQELTELRHLYLLATLERPLSVREAQLLGVCRLCRGPAHVGRLVLAYGKEHAHQRCLAGLNADEPIAKRAQCGKELV